jgi:isopenicillin N synthase-like dioxygenase
MADFSVVPVVDVGPLLGGGSGGRAAADAIGHACRTAGFFYVTGHGIPAARITEMEELFRRFFALPAAAKMDLRMERAGRAWRGYFPVFGELTSGQPDVKEGLYFGAEHGDDHPRVRAGVPLHGKNLFPDIPFFRDAVLSWMADMTRLGRVILRGIALSLGLPEDYFDERYLRDPTVLFRAFHYPPPPAGEAPGWGVGEHTDYGWLTILWQDGAGGLQVKSRSRWIEAAPVPGSFVCNIGDMLDRMTGGLYRSTPHRVRNESGRDRLSLPFFFDPDWDAEIAPIDTRGASVDDAAERWDQASVHGFRGTYGQYLLGKVSKVFPELGRAAL